jgi:transposase
MVVRSTTNNQSREGPKMQVSIIGIDLAKHVFYVHGCDADGKPVLRKQLARRQLLSFVANLPRCLVAMEACASAHYWAREIEKLGHQVRLIAPKLVRPYVKANKNDASDAEAICAAASRPSMRFVAIKSTAQQDVRAVHRLRQQLVKTRTSLVQSGAWAAGRIRHRDRAGLGAAAPGYTCDPRGSG